VNGTLALVGGREWTEGCSFDAELIGEGSEVLVVPAALAYENPGRAVERATRYFAELGATVRVLDVYRRVEALEEEPARIASEASVVYVASGSPMHLRSVLKNTPLLDALVGSWRAGATVLASAEGASVLCSHMVDSRGGAFTVGLELITTMTVIPRYNQWSPEKWHRTVALAPSGMAVVGIDEATALIRSPDGGYHVSGVGGIHVFVDGKPADRSDLPADLGPTTD